MLKQAQKVYFRASVLYKRGGNRQKKKERPNDISFLILSVYPQQTNESIPKEGNTISKSKTKEHGLNILLAQWSYQLGAGCPVGERLIIVLSP